MLPEPHHFKQRWKELLAARGGSWVITSDKTRLFYFAHDSDTAKLVEVWEDALGTRELFLVGNFPSGDLVCAHPSGELFVVLHDTFAWWDSDVSLDEFLKRLDSGDEELEEDVYSRPHGNPHQQRRHPGLDG